MDFFEEPEIEDDELDDGFVFMNPLEIGPLTVRSTQEYQDMLSLIHDQYYAAGFDDEDIEFYDEDFSPTSDADTAEGTRIMLSGMMNKDLIIDTSALAAGFGQMGEFSSAHEMDLEGMTSGFSQLVNEFSLDDVLFDKQADRLTINPYEPQCRQSLELRQGLYPPRPPLVVVYANKPVSITVSRSRSTGDFRLRSHLKWADVLSHHMGTELDLGAESHFSMASGRRPSDAVPDYGSTSSLETLSTYVQVEMKSNSRPRGGYVLINMADGTSHNIGTHSYVLSSDMNFPLDMTSAHLALCELFSAQAGEGLACATGSHSLHQMVSAIVSAAIQSASPHMTVLCEHKDDDIVVIDPDHPAHDWCFDVTSTAGIWHKPLRRRKMIVISKYDVAAVLVNADLGPPSQVLAYGIACALAVEHPSFYGNQCPEALPQDLQIQLRISNQISSMSQKTVTALAEMSYQSCIAECVQDALDLDPKQEGVSYKVKAQVLIDTIHNLSHKDKYAFPPFPTSEIRGFWDSHVEVKFLDQMLVMPSAPFVSDFTGTTIKPEDNNIFLKKFPADGRYSYSDVVSTCECLLDSMLPASGETHLGPYKEIDPDTPDSDLWDAVSKIYGASAIAQFAEVRADVVRAVDQSPASGSSTWRATSIYKGKVIAFHRSRDNVADARGYRVDWFALSAFSVMGSIDISSDPERPIFLWPRQRLRSQEMDIAGMAPRRLKLTLFTMLSMRRACRADVKEVCLAWQKLALTAMSSTWASGANFITCRHLSASLASPSPPFDAMAKKFKPPQTAACILYFTSLLRCLTSWNHRDQYHDRAAILGLPRAYSQLESYWLVWVPDEFADSTKHFTDCVMALYGEYQDLSDTARTRIADLLSQYELVTRPEITVPEIRASIRASCSLETGGKFGWSVFGSMASAYALTTQGSPSWFDKTFARGGRARNLASHLTVRHSGRINQHGRTETGTVAEMIIKQGTDVYLSTLSAGVRFYYGKRPYFLNHPKKGEHKDREISITDPDSRIMLNDAEHICGEYGRNTQIDMLKRPDKDAFFYRISSEAFLKGGVVKASDASRFAAMMSNVAVGITCYTLGSIGGSAHLQASASIYKRLATRQMVIDTAVLDEINKRLEQVRPAAELSQLRKARAWIRGMPKVGEHDGNALRAYCTAAHTGQGMSHVGMSIEHGGALLISLAAAEHAEIYIRKQRVHVAGIPLVTSDDSTIVAGLDEKRTTVSMSRSERQRACHLFLRVQDRTRQVALRSVSVMPNLSKEKTSGIAGEFNSQDNGIGVACPVLGYREMICQLTRPCSQSLITDYLNVYAYGRTVALSGLGISAGVYAQRMALDALEQRWKFTQKERAFLESIPFLPSPLIQGATSRDILKTPASMLSGSERSALMQLALEYHAESAELNIHTRDMAFTVLGHVRVHMKRQHKKALAAITNLLQVHEDAGRKHQAELLRQALTSTMSSARTRGAGRIAQRIKGKQIRPEAALGCDFQRAPMLESTFQWFDYLRTRLGKTNVSSEVGALSVVYGGYVTCNKFSPVKFPQPATRRRSTAVSAKKPRYILEGYGSTPFGRHVLERSQAKVIPEFTQVERREVSIYQALRTYRSIPEHVQYGGKLVYSWSRMESCMLAHVSPSHDLEITCPTDEYWGGMSEDDISFLREAEMADPDVPVLAMNYAASGRAHFHAVYRGQPYSASIDFDPDTSPQYARIPAIARGGKPVVLAMQSWSTERVWYGTGPTGDEVQTYQHDGKAQHDNIDADAAWDKLENQDYARVPMAASLVEQEGKKILYMINPKLDRRCDVRLLPYHKAKFLLNIATGGYWYSALHGVCMRAYLKGHHGHMNSWTGPVLGWRMSRNPEPTYGWSAPDHGCVRSLTVVGGIDNDEALSVLNPTEFASGHCYVDRQGMHLVHESHVLTPTYTVMSYLLKLNGGEFLFTSSQGRAHLIDCELPAPRVEQSSLSIQRVGEELWSLVHGRQVSADSFI